MNGRCVLALGLAVAAMTAGCSDLPRQPGTETAAQSGDRATDFVALYPENCAGCHGARGQGGAAIALANPVYQAIVTAEVLTTAISNGVAGTSMPPFAESAGGSLTQQQISTLVTGMRKWSKPEELAGAQPPPYAANLPGNAPRGAQVFATFCSSCHGPDGKGGKQAGSLVDPSYLALISNQYLRTVVIVGRPELDAPDWRADLPGHAMTDDEVSDVVAWLAARRVPYPGQPYPVGNEGSTGKGAKP